MSRSKNQVETVQLTIAATPQMVVFLRQLTDTGLFGKNPTEAAERLLARALEERVSSGELKSYRRTTK